MDISQLELTRPGGPGAVADTVTDEMLGAAAAIVYGKAKHLSRLQSSSTLRYLWISGVNAQAAEIVARVPGLQRLVIHDFRLPDVGPLARLDSLTELTIAGSPKLKSLTGVERLRGLRRLILFDNCNYPDVRALAALVDLETLCLEGGFSKQLKLPTLEPLGDLHKLRRLRLASLRVADRSLRPLHGLMSLREVFIARVFSPGEFRALGAALPDARGEFVDSFRTAP